jgi:hypothetical protein
MASLRQSLMAAAAGTVLLVSAITYLSDQFSSQKFSEMGAQELTISEAAAHYVKKNAQETAAAAITFSVNGNPVTIDNGQYSNALTVTALVQNGYLGTPDEQLANGATPSIVVRNEHGGLSVLTVPGNPQSPVAFGKNHAGEFMEQNAWLGEISQHPDANNAGATLVAMGGAFQGNAGNYGVNTPAGNGFVPVALQWVPSDGFTQAAAAAHGGGAIANLQPGQSYTDPNGNTFTAYNSSQGVLIYVPVPAGYLWFPQSVFSETPPSLSGFYVPQGTGTGDHGEGPYAITVSGNAVTGYWNGQAQQVFPLSDF